MTPHGSVPAHLDIRLATNADADAIALLSRSEIEHELPWTWTPSRVRQAIAGGASNVAVAYDGGRLVALGIMTYGDLISPLHLLAVHPLFRRRDVGSAVLRWLEKVARVAG
jgi:GNAT superfamily N-acetyltransferase